MSELNVYHHELRSDEYEEFYLKSEADNMIALLKDKANYNEYAYKRKSEELADSCRFYEDELRHHKYKRCMAMAEWCNANYFRQYMFKPNFWKQWHNRWLELAEKFKG
jgi:hypothetical protein